MSSPLFLVTFNSHGRRGLLNVSEVLDAFVEYCGKGVAAGVKVGRFGLMPDHVHLFVCFSASSKISLGNWVKGLKRHVGQRLISLGKKPFAPPGQKLRSFWQPGFHDHALRSDESYAVKWEYVRDNPVRAGLVSEACAWPYAGEIVQIDRA